MTDTYQLWTNYKGLVNRFNIGSNNTVNTFNELLYRSEGVGNKNYYTGTIGNNSYTNVQIFEEDFFNSENYGVSEGTFVVRFPSGNDAATQNLTANATTQRTSMDSFHSKTGLTSEEIANFYGHFSLSRGFNREYRIKSSTKLDSLTQSTGRTQQAHQAKVSLNNDGNFVNVDDGDFKIRFTSNDENPFQGIGILFGFASWPLKEDILFPKTPDKFNTTYALKCFFDEDVTDLQTSHVTATNCTIVSVYKKSAKEQWVIFTINSPSGTNFYTEYSLKINKDSVTAVNDTNKIGLNQFLTNVFQMMAV